ncbi:MAG: hypothetical protein WBD22_07530 [Pyrinomonadaceae bacterium]
MTNEASIDARAAIGKPRAIETIVGGGVAIGVFDILEPILFFWLLVGASPMRVLQGVAAGLLGRDAAVAGGWKTALLGLGLHFFIATTIATVFYFASLALPMLIRRPLLWGILYGIACYFVMNFIVVPLSAAPRMAFSFPMLLHGIAVHAFFVGLPVAFIAGWSAERNR